MMPLGMTLNCYMITSEVHTMYTWYFLTCTVCAYSGEWKKVTSRLSKVKFSQTKQSIKSIERESYFTYRIIFFLIEIDVPIQNLYKELNLERGVHALVCYFQSLL